MSENIGDNPFYHQFNPDDYPQQHEDKSETISFTFDIPMAPIPGPDVDLSDLADARLFISTYHAQVPFGEMLDQMAEERKVSDGLPPRVWRSHRESYTHILERLEDYWAAVKMPVEDAERDDVMHQELIRLGAAVLFALCEPEV